MLGYVYNRVLERIMLPLGDRIEGGAFMNRLQQYRQEQWLSAEELRTLQRDRLTSMLAYARARVPFYADAPAPLMNPFEDIKQFPVLHKADINENVNQLVTKSKEKLIASSGSGSSGVQGTVYLDKAAQASQRAMQMLWFEWCGYQAGDSVLQTGMTLNRGFIKGIKDRLLQTMYVPAFTLDADSLKAVLQEVKKRPRQYLFGYASSLFVLAQTALDLGISTIKFEYAVSWGDKLFPHYREKIREAFGCQTLDTYGCTEGAMIGAQCSEKNFHLCINQCYIEIVDDNGQSVPVGQMGRVLATRLDNFAMPLIRYYLGDLVELESENQIICGCKRQLPLLRRIIGRDTDIVRTKSGKSLIVHFFTGIFEHIHQIRQFKVVQENLESIDIHYIPNFDFGVETLQIVENKIHEHLDENLSIHWVKTNYIAPTKSGKPQIIQSFLNQSLKTKEETDA